MPELAEVEFYRRQWDSGLGQRIDRIHVNSGARVFRECSATEIQHVLTGRKLRSSRAHGKNWIFGFDKGEWLSGHLGMSGELHSHRTTYEVSKHDHLVLITDSVSLVFTDPRMFGKIRLDETKDSSILPEWWSSLPPEILSDHFTKVLVSEFVSRFPKTPIKTLLLDQRAFPGIGNWMADEICWRMKTAPQTPSGSLRPDQVAQLWRTLRRVSRQALHVIGRNWGAPPKTWLFPHRWQDGGSCPRKSCLKEKLRRADLRGRTTCWCPTCQGKREINL